MALDLSDDEKLALVALLTRTIGHDRYPMSPRVRILKDVLAKLDVKPPAQLNPAVKAPSRPQQVVRKRSAGGATRDVFFTLRSA